MIDTLENLEQEHVQLSAVEMLENKWAEGKFLCVGIDVVPDETMSLY